MRRSCETGCARADLANAADGNQSLPSRLGLACSLFLREVQIGGSRQFCRVFSTQRSVDAEAMSKTQTQ